MTMKNIFKKATAGIITLSVAMSMCVMPIAAEEVQGAQNSQLVYDYEVELLKKLNIASEDLLSDMTADITRGEFAELLTGLMGLGGGGNALDELYNLGIVNGYGSGSLKELQAVTTHEAIKMLVCALGYSMLAEGEGGYPLGYVQLAYDCDMIKGAITNSALTVEQAIRLIVDAGNTNMATKKDNIIINQGEFGGDTMFYTYFGIERYRGVLTANGYTSIDGKDCTPGRVTIAGETLDKGDTTADDYLGYNVEAYAYWDEMLGEIIVAAPRPNYNEVVKFPEGTYPEVTGTLQDFRVKGEIADGTTKRIDFKSMPKVIRNGVYYDGFNLDVLRTVPADLTFINNDREAGFDIIKIEQYETYIIESVDVENEIVYGKYDGDLYTGTDPSMPANYTKVLNANAEDENVFIYKTADRMGSFNDLVEGTAISVMESDDGSFKKIYILPDSITGVIGGMATRGMRQVITINGVEYFISEEYKNFSVKDKIEPQIGIKVRAVLGLNGEIVDMTMAEDSWVYGYIMRMGYNRDLEMFTNIKIYSQAGKAVELAIGEKITIDGIRVANNDKDFIKAGIARLSGGFEQAKRQLIRYKANETNITHIDTTKYNPGSEDLDSLQGGVTYSGKFSNAGICIYSGNEVLLCGTDETLLIQIPTTEAYKNDERFYQVAKMNGKFRNGMDATLIAYNVNERGVAKIVIREQDTTTNPDNHTNIMFLKKIKQVANATGDVVYNVEAINLATGAEYSNNTSSENIQKNDANIALQNASFGDTFRFVDRAGTLWAAESGGGEWKFEYFANPPKPGEVKQHSDDSDSSISGSKDSYAESRRLLYGYITYADDTHVELSVDEAGTGATPFYIKGKKVYVADFETETIEELPISRIAAHTADNMPNTKAVLYQRAGDVLALVIYKNIP